MQYKVSLNDKMWNMKEGLAIWLWKSDDEGHPKLLNGVPKLVLFCPIWGNDIMKAMEKQIFNIARISNYLEFWNLNMPRDPKYIDLMKPYVEYWEGILEMLANPFLHNKV